MSEDIRDLTCIGCPLGCRLEIELKDGKAWRIDGPTCKKGKKYAEQEVTDPRRMLTTTVALAGGLWERLPVKSASPVPKDAVIDICRTLHTFAVDAPVAMGDVVLEDAGGTGVSIVATRSMPAGIMRAHR